MSEELIGVLVLGVLIALFFFTPRRTRFSPQSHPAGPVTKAVGVLLLIMLAVGTVGGIVCRELTSPSR